MMTKETLQQVQDYLRKRNETLYFNMRTNDEEEEKEEVEGLLALIKEEITEQEKSKLQQRFEV